MTHQRGEGQSDAALISVSKSAAANVPYVPGSRKRLLEFVLVSVSRDPFHRARRLYRHLDYDETARMYRRCSYLPPMKDW